MEEKKAGPGTSSGDGTGGQGRKAGTEGQAGEAARRQIATSGGLRAASAGACCSVAWFLLAGLKDRDLGTIPEHDNGPRYRLPFSGAKPGSAGAEQDPQWGWGGGVALGTHSCCRGLDAGGHTHPLAVSYTHVCAHVHVPGSRGGDTSVSGCGCLWGHGPCAQLSPVQPAASAARLLSLLLLSDFFFLLQTWRLIISHLRNVAAFSQQLNCCPVRDGG